MFKIVFVFIIISLLPLKSFCQNLSNYDVKNISEQNGLPSNESYHAVEDQLGYIWIATDKGLSKYNGLEHKVFDARDGIPESCVLHLFLQPDTSIVGVTMTGEIFKVKNDSVQLLINMEMYKILDLEGYFPYSFSEDENGHYHVGTRRGYFIFNKSGEVLKSPVPATDDILRINVKEQKNGYPLTYHTQMINGAGYTQRTSIYLNDKLIFDSPELTLNDKSIYVSKTRDFTVIPFKNSFFVVWENGKKQVHKKLGFNVIASYAVDDHIFIGTRNNGVFHYQFIQGELLLRNTLFQDLSVSSILKNSEDLLWFTTLEDGVKVINLNDSEVYFNGSKFKIITAFTMSNDGGIIGLETGEVLTPQNQVLLKTKGKISNLIASDEYLTVASYPFSLLPKMDNNLPYSYKSKLTAKIGARDVIQTRVNEFIGISRRSIFQFKKGEIKKTLKLNERIRNSLRVGENLFFSFDYEIRKMNEDFEQLAQYSSKSKIEALFEENNKVFCITEDLAIFEIQEDGLQFRGQLKLYSFEDDSRATCLVYFNGIVHISTNKGTYSWKCLNGFRQFELLNFESIRNVNEIQFSNDTLYFITKKKIMRKAVSDLHYSIPRLYLHNLKSNRNGMLDVSELAITYEDPSFHLRADPVDFSGAEIVYRYQLLGFDKTERISSDPSIIYENLAPGEYRLIVSVSSNGVTFSDPISLTIRVSTPYWQTWLFKVFIVLCSLVIIYFIFKMRIRYLKRKFSFKESMTQLKSSALRSQLNPHLIFNVLNSIQGLVSEQKVEQANIYIAEFSTFLRNSLKYSKIDLISLEEEIAITRQYIDIERMRFKDQIKLRIVVNGDIDGIQVPPLIIQPIIENAIKHGIRPKNLEDNYVDVFVTVTDQQLLLKVEDGGIGFLELPKFGDGLLITTERIKLMNDKNSMEIVKKSDPTIVQLTFYL